MLHRVHETMLWKCCHPMIDSMEMEWGLSKIFSTALDLASHSTMGKNGRQRWSFHASLAKCLHPQTY
jgi:hypothetical protein